MQAPDLIKKIIAKRNISQAALAALLGVDRVQVTRYVAGDTSPGPCACLLLASLCDIRAEQDFFVALSGMNHDQLQMLGKFLGAPTAGLLSGDERAVLEFWRNPANQLEKHVRNVVEEIIRRRADD